MAPETMHSLDTASSFQSQDKSHQVKVSYHTGAHYEGRVVDYKRSGRGLFKWPNGSQYEGDYLENLRHGRGTQTWCDGSSYTGEFLKDLRHGQGCIQWSNGEMYEGTFFKDRRHGKGTYKWPDGTSYSGTFYMDKKEGYGTFHFSSGDIFQGLYLEDEREGPGAVTYQSGQQDVGFWKGEQMIKLCSDIAGAFTIESHPQYGFRPEDHLVHIDMRNDEHKALAPVENILNPPDFFDYPPKIDLSKRVSELYNESLDSRSLAIDRQTFDREFFKHELDSTQRQEPVVAWNSTPRMVVLQKHTLRHMFGKCEVEADIDAIVKLDRSKFGQRGLLEQSSEQLIQAAEAGNAGTVEKLLDSKKVNADVSDCHGHTALIGATVNWHMDVINILLNHGANVNQVNDEGCSALAAGAVFYYPIEGFIHNSAERYPEPHANLEALDSEKDSRSKIDIKCKERKVNELNEINMKISADNSDLKSVPVSKPKSQTTDTKNITAAPVYSTKNNLLKEVYSIDEVASNKESTSLEKEENNNEDKTEGVLEDDTSNNKGAKMEKDNNDLDNVETELEEFQEKDNAEDFESNKSIIDFHINVRKDLIERCATELSHNEFVVNRKFSEAGEVENMRLLAVQMSRHERMKQTLQLLLRRGADPNISWVPMPILFLAIKSGDVDMVRLLLLKGADANVRLSKEKGGLYPLHIACALPGDEGTQITELLLNALADPDARAEEDDSFCDNNLVEEWSKDAIPDSARAQLGGRTALQIACARDDDYKKSGKIVQLLLQHKADTNLTCNGFSPLALAIASGNDLAVDELLFFGADPSLPLTHGVGNAICVATNPQHEHRRSLQGRLQLIDKLITAGADVLAPVCIGPKRLMGTAVDYAYHMFNQDRRIAHMPYHALSHSERETYNARRKLLSHIGEATRQMAVEREKRRNLEEEKEGVRTQSPSANFLYIGAGAKLPPGYRGKLASKGGQDHITFESSENEEGMRTGSPIRKPLFKYCYECGRSVGVRLTACTRCKEVYFCSKACKLKAWSDRHKEECIRIGGRSRSPSPKHKPGSPAPGSAHNKAQSKNTEGDKKLRKFRTGSPPHYEYVYIDNYTHN